MPAAYFLANYYFRSGHPLDGLQQTAILARLSPRGTETVAPLVAAYAQDHSNWPQMRALFRAQPGIEDESSCGFGAGRTQRRRDPRHCRCRPSIARQQLAWVLLANLITSGDYTRARSIWSSVGGGHTPNSSSIRAFRPRAAAPPFNWALTSSTLGLAERQSGNRLHVIFYGNEDGVLASQLQTLVPGAYQIEDADSRLSRAR